MNVKEILFDARALLLPDGATTAGLSGAWRAGHSVLLRALAVDPAHA